MLYLFTNRRRAKDALLSIQDVNGYDGTLVFVREGSVYVSVPGGIPNIAGIMHFAIDGGDIYDKMNLDEITELYRNDGLLKFRT